MAEVHRLKCDWCNVENDAGKTNHWTSTETARGCNSFEKRHACPDCWQKMTSIGIPHRRPVTAVQNLDFDAYSS